MIINDPRLKTITIYSYECSCHFAHYDVTNPNLNTPKFLGQSWRRNSEAAESDLINHILQMRSRPDASYIPRCEGRMVFQDVQFYGLLHEGVVR